MLTGAELPTGNAPVVTRLGPPRTGAHAAVMLAAGPPPRSDRAGRQARGDAGRRPRNRAPRRAARPCLRSASSGVPSSTPVWRLSTTEEQVAPVRVRRASAHADGRAHPCALNTQSVPSDSTSGGRDTGAARRLGRRSRPHSAWPAREPPGSARADSGLPAAGGRPALNGKPTRGRATPGLNPRSARGVAVRGSRGWSPPPAPCVHKGYAGS